MTFYDEDKNHIITIVEYNMHISKDNFATSFNVSGRDLDKAIMSTICKKKKFHLGVRMAKELIK